MAMESIILMNDSTAVLYNGSIQYNDCRIKPVKSVLSRIQVFIKIYHGLRLYHSEGQFEDPFRSEYRVPHMMSAVSRASTFEVA